MVVLCLCLVLVVGRSAKGVCFCFYLHNGCLAGFLDKENLFLYSAWLLVVGCLLAGGLAVDRRVRAVDRLIGC